jgi:hypothetical protein
LKRATDSARIKGVRHFTLLLTLATLAAAQDPREIVRRSIELDRKNLDAARNYTYMERQEQRELDGAGKVKNLEVHVFDVTRLEGSPYRRLVSHGDQPLSAKEQQQQEERLRKSIEERRKESPEQKRQRIADWERKQEKQREPLREMPDAFDFRLTGEEQLNGGDVYVIDASPKPGYKPKASSAFFLPKVKVRLWIDKSDFEWAKVEMETLDTITFAGLLVRLAKGTRLTLEQTRVNDEVWLPKRVALEGSVRLLLLKKLRGRMDYIYSGYRKFQTDSRVTAFGQ